MKFVRNAEAPTFCILVLGAQANSLHCIVLNKPHSWLALRRLSSHHPHLRQTRSHLSSVHNSCAQPKSWDASLVLHLNLLIFIHIIPPPVSPYPSWVHCHSLNITSRIRRVVRRQRHLSSETSRFCGLHIIQLELEHSV